MTDTTTDVKEFLRSKISEMTQQLRKITDAEDIAATHTLVGKCYLEMTRPINSKVEPTPWQYVKFVNASGGKLTVMTIKVKSDDVLEVSERVDATVSTERRQALVASRQARRQAR